MRELLLAALVILTVPAYDGDWPTLGWQVVGWMRENLVHGPGDIRGEPLRLDDEKIGFILRMYEVYPQGHEQEGRRRFDRCGISVPKGSSKTELGALVSAAELHPEAPVRFNGFGGNGELLQGRGVRDPFIPMVAYTEEQSDELAYGALRVILLNSRVAGDFDIGAERILRAPDGDGKAVSLASSPNARDGARTTFQLFDETHRFTTPELRKAHETMLANIPKRSAISEPWTLELSTAFDPSERSVASRAHSYAKTIAEGRSKNSRLFYFHRQADDTHDLTTTEGRSAAVIQARGPYVSKWSNIRAIAGQWDDPEADKDYLARVWLNQIRHSSERAFDIEAWKRRARAGYRPADGALVGLGFDGSIVEDSTALVATEIPTGFQWPIDIWEKPLSAEDWHVPEARVDEAVTDAFERYDVFRMYADPFYWGNWIDIWAGRYGENDHGLRVVRWPTNQWKKTADMCRAYANAMQDAPKDLDAEEFGEPLGPPCPEELRQAALVPDRISHDGDARMSRHIANAHKMPLHYKDKRGARLWVIQKSNPGSPDKIDGAMSGGLSWQARRDAITLGLAAPKKRSVYETRGLEVI